MKQKLWNIEAAFYLIWQAATYFLKKIFAFSLIYFLLFLKWGKLTIAIFSFALFMSLQFFHFLNEKQSAVLLLILFSLKSQNKYFLFFSYIPCICFHLKRKILSLFNRKASGCSSADPIFFEKPEHPPPLLPCVKGLKTSAGCFYNFAPNISYFKWSFARSLFDISCMENC